MMMQENELQYRDGFRGEDEAIASPPPRDELDSILRRWHEKNADAARSGRDRLVAQLAAERSGKAPRSRTTPPRMKRRVIAPPYLRAAASLLLLVTLITLLLPLSSSRRADAKELMLPEGGKLQAFDDAGDLIGPCPLEHTDVDIDISGRFTRVTLTQRFLNAYDAKVEAVYSFPLSHRAAVDRMAITVGDRVVVGEVKERRQARRVYEAARDQGYVAALLEQERPNIFTQSVANIEPGAEVLVEISYVELVQVSDGVYRFDFPMVVAPRYIPGSPTVSHALLPAELKPRRGVLLQGPATMRGLRLDDPDPEQFQAIDEAFAKLPEGALTPLELPDGTIIPILSGAQIQSLLHAATPIEFPGPAWWGEGEHAVLPDVWAVFEAVYCGGERESGFIYDDGTGKIGNRWFFTDLKASEEAGTGFAADTNEVPDASRITPMPVRPDRRAGHDISIDVTIDTGGPAILDIACESHEIRQAGDARFKDRGNVAQLALKNRNEIPNKDFLLSWRVEGDAIEESHFAHHSDGDAFGDYAGGFFTLMLEPPARVDDAIVPERELIFVLDCSGSMKDQPIEKAKSVMLAAIDTMRPVDTFNVVTFNNDSQILWDASRQATPNNVAEAKQHIDSRQGGGGTEMLTAVRAALAPRVGAEQQLLTPRELADLPADGRAVEVLVAEEKLEVLLQDGIAPGLLEIRLRDDLGIRVEVHHWTLHLGAFTPEEPFGSRDMYLQGHWVTRDGERLLVVDHATDEVPVRGGAARYVFFLTDGEVGNDFAVVDAVRDHAHRARVFTVGIGSSPNRYLLDAMAKAGRGKSDYVSLAGDADAAVKRFVQRIERPVLTNIELEFDGVEIVDAIPPLDRVPDLFDEEPLIIHGRYENPGKGTLTIRGTTGEGRFERRVDVTLPEKAAEHDVIATLWARSKVDAVMEERGERAEVVKLGETFQIMTQHTSFVAVEKSRMTIGGEPMLVTIPIELPEGQSWSGTFGSSDPAAVEHLASQMASQLLAYRDASAKAQGEPEKEIAALVATAREHEDAGRWHSAIETWKSVLAHDPDHAQARAGIESMNEMIEAGQSIHKSEMSHSQLGAAVALEAANAVKRAQELLKRDDFAGAKREALAGQIRLRRGRTQLDETQFEAMDEPFDRLLTRIDREREVAGLNDQQRIRREARAVERRTPRQEDPRRQADIQRKLGEIRQAQLDHRYGDALQTIEEVLFIDENNPSALAMRDVITATQLYRDYAETERPRELSYSRASLDNQLRTVTPQPRESIVRGKRALIQSKSAGVAGRHEPAFSGAAGGGSFDATFEATFEGEIQLPVVIGDELSPGEELHFLNGSESSFLPGGQAEVARRGSAPAVGKREPRSLMNEGRMNFGVAVGSDESVIAFSADVPFDGVEGASIGDATIPMYGDIPALGSLFTRSASEEASDEPRLTAAKMIFDHLNAVSIRTYFENQRVEQVIAFLEDVSGVPFSVDWGALAEIGVTAEDQVTVRTASRTAIEAISNVLATLGSENGRPAFAISDAGVLVTSAREIENARPPVDEALEAILLDESISREQRRAKLAAELEKRIEARVTAAQRRARLLAVVDEQLLSFALIADSPREFDKAYKGPKPESWADGGVRVSILLVDTKPVTLGKLRNLGVQIEGQAEALPLLVARAPLGRLVELALQPSVRRIEPAAVTSAR